MYGYIYCWYGDESSGSYSFYYDSTTADQMSKTFPYILESSSSEYSAGTAGNRHTERDDHGGDHREFQCGDYAGGEPSAEDARAILDTAIAIYPDTARFVLGDIQFNMLDEPSTPTEPFNQMGSREAWLLAVWADWPCQCVSGCAGFAPADGEDQDEMKEITSLRCLAAVPLVRLKARKNQKQQKISVLDERLPYGYRESMRGLKLRRAEDGRLRRESASHHQYCSRRGQVHAGCQSGATYGGGPEESAPDRRRSQNAQ